MLLNVPHFAFYPDISDQLNSLYLFLLLEPTRVASAPSIQRLEWEVLKIKG
jgi:hypothetical protein